MLLWRIEQYELPEESRAIQTMNRLKHSYGYGYKYKLSGSCMRYKSGTEAVECIDAVGATTRMHTVTG